MNILISNDDGVFKYGLKVLANALASMEDVNVYVFAPSRERSCAGHGLFLHEEQIVTPYSTEGFDRVEGVWACSGTPADCVKTGISILRTKGIPVDMVCTGVNHGSNLGRDIHYSGTISAAMEGLFLGVPSIAFSLCSHEALYFEAFPSLIPQVVKAAKGNVPRDTILSVNVPDIPAEQLKGVRVCPIGPRDYTDGIEFLRNEEDSEVWQYVSKATYRDDPDPEWDVTAWQEGWVTVTPVQMMHENPKMLDLVRSWGITLENSK